MNRGNSGIVRWGVLGAAEIAVRRMIPTLYTHPFAQLGAVATRSGNRADCYASAPGARVYRDYRDLLGDAEIDALYVPLPNALHAEWAMRSLRAGKHVLVEKPLALSEAEAAELRAVAVHRGRVLMECMTFPRHIQHTLALGLVAGGTIGQLRGMTAAFTIPPRTADDIRYRADLGGGALWDLGGYLVAAVAQVFGADLTVADATLRVDPTFPGIDIGGQVVLAGVDGHLARLRFALDAEYRCEYALYGDNGSIAVHRAFTPPPEFEPSLTIHSGGCGVVVASPADDQFANVISDFTAAVRGDFDWQADLDAACRRVRLLDEVRQRAERQR